MKIEMSKVYCLDENVIFPPCHQCGKELTPFGIDDNETNKIPSEFLKGLIQYKYIQFKAINQTRHLIWLCKNCCDIIKER